MASRQLTNFLHRLLESTLRRGAAEFSDGELLDAFIVQRDEAAFEALLRLHGPTRRGIYELDGDTLKVCWSGDASRRPTEFDSSSKGMVATFKRNKD